MDEAPARHWRQDVWRLYAFAGLAALALLAISLLPSRASDPPAGTLIAWERNTATLGLVAAASLGLALIFRVQQSKLGSGLVLAVAAALWIAGAWSERNAVVLIDRSAVTVGDPLPWKQDQVVPLGQLTGATVACETVTMRKAKGAKVSFTLGAPGGPVEVSEGFNPSRPLPQAWVEGALALRRALEAEGLRVRGGGVASRDCLSRIQAQLPEAARPNFQALMAPPSRPQAPAA